MHGARGGNESWSVQLFEQSTRQSAYRRVISVTISLRAGRAELWKIVNFSRGVPRHLSRGETEIHFSAVASNES